MVTEIDRLLDHHTETEIARLLNQRGVCSGEGLTFHSRTIARIRRRYQLKSRYDRLREQGLLRVEEMSDRLKLTPAWIRTWRNHGLLRAYPVCDKKLWLYEDPGPNPPRKAQGIKLSERCRFPENVVHGAQEVQYEA